MAIVREGRPRRALGAAGLEGLIVLHQRQLDALTGAVNSALHGAHAIASRQCDAVAETYRQLAALFAATPGLNDGVGPGFDFVKRAIATSVAQAVALAEIATKAQVEALTIFGRSVADNLDGLRPAGLAGGRDAGRSVGS
jgi:hypothetical protein